MSIEKMAASRGSVLTPHHHMSMNYRLPLIERDVTTHSDHFMLTLDGDLLVHFALEIKPPQRSGAHSSDDGEGCTRNVILLRDFLKSGKGLVSLVQDDRILLCLFAMVQQLNLHLGRLACGNG